MTLRRLLHLLPLLLGLCLALPLGGAAQFLSPGRLAEPHAELEGLRRCTTCHELGQRGISSDRCLDCHEAVSIRIQDGRGYHATVQDEDCASCHQEHLGSDFDLLHLDQGTFNHLDTGYELELSHESVEDCRECHQPSQIADPDVVSFKTERGALARTFLGLSGECSSCHEEENPHGNQFGIRGCVDCHDAGVWETPPNFDHAATRYPLDGLHADVGCAGCHGTDPAAAVYRPLAFQACNNCHADPHDGSMNDTCASCHGTSGWQLVSTDNVERRFDHATTAFPLVGAHAVADCRACHQRGRAPSSSLLRMAYVPGTAGSAYPTPIIGTCLSCHVEQHPSPPPDLRWSDCESCHSEVRWAPSPYNLERHAGAGFSLTGAHVVTPCVSCHQSADRGHTAFTLALPAQACADCHAADDPHGEVYAGMACADCHVTEAFDLAEFDHAFITDGANDPSCASCHSVDDPHAGQFDDQDCSTCHATDAFTTEGFDHNVTQFVLDGAHATTPCASCHVPEAGTESVVRYKPIGTECTDCHGGAL